MSTPTREKRPIATALLCLLVLGHAGEEARASDSLKKLAANSMTLLRQALTGCLDTELETAYGAGAGQVGYEMVPDGAGGMRKAKIRDVLTNASALIARGRVSEVGHGDRGSRTRRVDGLGSDRIRVATGIRNRICGAYPLGTSPETQRQSRMSTKLELAVLIVGDALRAFQKRPDKNDLQTLADAERDVHCLRLKVAMKLANAMSAGAANDAPHGAVGGVAGDPEGMCVPALSAMLVACGVVNGDMDELRNHVLSIRGDVKDSKDDAGFDPDDPSGWAQEYYGEWWRSYIAMNSENDPGRFGATYLEVSSGSSVFCSLPGGEQLTQSMAYSNSFRETMVVCASSDGLTQRLRFWRDTDGDGVPESSEAALPVQLPGAGGDPGLDGIRLYEGVPELLSPAGLDRGFVVHDIVSGTLHVVATGDDGLPIVGQGLLIINDPLLCAAGGFPYRVTTISPNPGDLRFVFSDAADPAQDPSMEAMWWDVLGADPITGGTVVAAPPGGTLAEAEAPTNGVGATPVSRGSSLSRMTGNPGAVLQFAEVGHGFVDVIATEPVDPSGYSAPFVIPHLEPGGPDEPLILRVQGIGEEDLIFVPRRGSSAGHVEANDDGLGNQDRLDLTVDPPRLHFSAGTPQPSVYQHVYELVLSEDGLHPGQLSEDWDAGDRRLDTETGSIDFQRLPGSVPPLYVQSVHDFDGDSQADEGVIIRRQAGQPNFFFEMVDSVHTTPFPVFQVQLPPDFEPLVHAVHDADFDGDLDVTIQSIDGPLFRLDNDGSGVFQPIFELYPGSGEDLKMTASLNGGPNPGHDVVTVVVGDAVGLDVDSPGGTYWYEGFLVVGQFFTTGLPPVSPAVFPSLRVSPGGSPGPFLLINGLLPTPLGPADVIQPGGTLHTFLMPPGLNGQSLMTQALVVDPSAANGFFAASGGIEVRFP